MARVTMPSGSSRSLQVRKMRACAVVDLLQILRFLYRCSSAVQNSYSEHIPVSPSVSKSSIDIFTGTRTLHVHLSVALDLQVACAFLRRTASTCLSDVHPSGVEIAEPC